MQTFTNYCALHTTMMPKIRDILLIQKQEIENMRKEEYIPREAKIEFGSPLIQVVIGPRRAGKSFFVTHTVNYRGLKPER